jgi:hypothetical protein
MKKKARDEEYKDTVTPSGEEKKWKKKKKEEEEEADGHRNARKGMAAWRNRTHRKVGH